MANLPEQVQSLIEQTRRQIIDPNTQRNVIELIEKIIIYKFPQKSRQELEAMFNLTEWKQTKFYQEAKEEGKLETIPLLVKLGLNEEQIARELNRLFGLCYAMDGGYKGWNPYVEKHLAIFVNCF
ncbi:Rpn family recombination-promoting nuclease/putative transposase [Microcystis aeruginosa]|uniref:Rpn family recombination-promoting nuclease/putative transposase n=1 Tax=Microcystis aeruginosa TaxID=1126 RepID=UPI0021AB7B53|nr:Rpn family recombination-promoting nuclease/putative transposase [Microcystis aeruginosa]